MSEDIKRHVKVYVRVFIALAVLTVVTVAVAEIEWSTGLAIIVGLMIAGHKASLVALFFMHLSSEKKLIYSTLLITVLFFFVLLFLPLLTSMDTYDTPEPIYQP